MSEGLQNAPSLNHTPTLVEFAPLFEELLGPNGSWQLIETTALQFPNPRAYRMRFTKGERIVSYIAKRLEPAIARRNYLLLRRWLPAVGLSDTSVKLLGVAADRHGKYQWQIYDDLGNCALNPDSPLSYIRPVVELIAQLHLRFANHPLLAECRLHGGDLGANFFSSSLRDAIRALEALRPVFSQLPSEQSELCRRLLLRVYALSEQRVARTREIEELGGPETLLHGDLWTTNTFVVAGPNEPSARLLDWDHAAVGPITYDLSTFLLRFPSQRRDAILGLYREAISAAGWHLPATTVLNRLFETAEFSRFANRIIWPAVAFLQERADWALPALAEVEQWFQDWQPVLTEPQSTRELQLSAPGSLLPVAAQNVVPLTQAHHLIAPAPG